MTEYVEQITWHEVTCRALFTQKAINLNIQNWKNKYQLF